MTIRFVFHNFSFHDIIIRTRWHSTNCLLQNDRHNDDKDVLHEKHSIHRKCVRGEVLITKWSIEIAAKQCSMLTIMVQLLYDTSFQKGCLSLHSLSLSLSIAMCERVVLLFFFTICQSFITVYPYLSLPVVMITMMTNHQNILQQRKHKIN